MGLFSKKRHGKMSSVDAVGRRFVWRLENFSKFKSGSTLDSENILCFTKVKFHLHMELGMNGDVGLYLHYKSPGIPKYSYYFSNSQGHVMRQHTAHTIPNNTERCGHWNACYYPDLISFIGENDILCLNFMFDDDTLAVQRHPHQNTVSVLWTIPRLFQQVLNPFLSCGFLNDRSLLVVCMDVKKHSGTIDAVGEFTVDNIKDIVIFFFCRKGNIPPHSIELMDAHGNSIATLEKSDDSVTPPFVVPKDRVLNAIGMDGTLCIRIELQTGGNPLNVLNMLSDAHLQQLQQQGQGGDAACPRTRTGTQGDKNRKYFAMNGDD